MIEHNCCWLSSADGKHPNHIGYWLEPYIDQFAGSTTRCIDQSAGSAVRCIDQFAGSTKECIDQIAGSKMQLIVHRLTSERRIG